MRIVVTAGYNKSLHSIATMHKLIKDGHEVIGCIQVKEFQLSRVKLYLRQYGWKTFKAKFLTYLLINDNTYLSDETKAIKDYAKKIGISEYKTISSYCSDKNIKHIKVKSLNSKDAINFNENNDVDLLIYSGGGILRKKIIESTNKGVINPHSGFLPLFRGMNVIEWSLIYGFIPYTTIHFINTGIDTGKILLREKLNYNKNIYAYRGSATVHNIELLSKVINDFNKYNEKAIIQKKSEGKQFFIMHKYLKDILIKYIDKNDMAHLKENYNDWSVSNFK